MNELEKIDEQKLVSLIQNKDTSAMEYLYDHYAPALFGVIVRIVGQKEIAEEVLQDSFMKIWERINQYDASRGKIFTWMLNIVRHQAIDKMRSKEFKQTQKTDGIENHVYTYEKQNHLEPNTEGIGIRELMQNLHVNQRLVLDLIYFKGYSHSEVSKEYNIPLGTVKTRLRLALNELRIILNIK